MKSTLAVLAAALAVASGFSVPGHQKQRSAPAVAPRTNHARPPRVVAMNTERRHIQNPARHDRLRRRTAAIDATLDNEETLYFINATLGTPPQAFRLHLDTGSSDLWVNAPNSTLCAAASAPCSYAGTYDANASSTYEYIGSYFNISYVDGSGAAGDYVSDTFALDGTSTSSVNLSSLQFGVGYSSSSEQGILGIGYPVNEVQVGRAGLSAYKNLPAQLVADGYIATNAFSLWLNDLDANTGSILFGGVDTAQYTGSLQTLPIQPQAGTTYSEFLITLTGLTLGTTALGGSSLALAVLLDSGSSLTYLPDTIVQAIYDEVSAVYDSSEGAAYVPCDLASSNATLTFTFSSPNISVAMDELVLDLVTASGKRPTFQNGQTACLFGIAPAGTSTNVLGDTFLRSAYVVYDLENNEISIAPTNFNATATNVVEIATGTSGVPDATAVTNAVTATAGLVGSSTIGTSSSGGTSGSSSSSSSSAAAGPAGHGLGTASMLLLMIVAVASSTVVGLGLVMV